MKAMLAVDPSGSTTMTTVLSRMGAPMARQLPLRFNWIVMLVVLSEADSLSVTAPTPLQQLWSASATVDGAAGTTSRRRRRWQHRDYERSRQRLCFSTQLYNSLDDGNWGNSTKPENKDITQQKSNDEATSNLLNLINPYNAGKSLRFTLDSALNLASAIASTTSSTASRLPPERRSLYYNYYLDDKLGLSSELKDTTSQSSAWYSTSDTDDRPEVLVVGATGELGTILVKRLLLENKVRVRVLVRDLYSSTLNKLGTGVTYCQGDLQNMESLEFAVTDLDKIVFCAGHPTAQTAIENSDLFGIEEDLARRSRGAALVDGEGLRNLVQAYLNVRHADYGTSQTAKRVLFKFRNTSADFDLFAVDHGSVEQNSDSIRSIKATPQSNSYRSKTSLSQCSWKENKFHHGVFTGQVGRHGEAAIASVRLRSRNDPSEGLDFRSGGFAGFVCRICSNGGLYEAFVRTEAYERLGVEYVCEFKTASKSLMPNSDNTSRDKFSTVRLDFSDFRARMRPDARDTTKQALSLNDIPRFVGKDVRQIGFRYRGKNNSSTRTSNAYSGWSKFYLSLDYIKLYRGQPEPEFIYLSDARIPPVLQDGMIRDDIHRLVSASESGQLFGEDDAGMGLTDRSAEETYFKYKGEEIIKQSGLSYTIIRVAGYNELPSTDSSTVRLQKTNKNIAPVSRADLSQVIAGALLNPNACNLVLYMTKSQQRGVADGDIWHKFARLKNEKQQLELPFQ